MFQKIENLNNQMHQLETNNWLHHDLFTYQWWIIVLVNTIFLCLLFIFIDRKRIFQIALAFMVCYYIVCVSDDLGQYYGLWSYPHQFVPFISELDAVEFAVIPATFTILYQTFDSWQKYLIGGILISIACAFIGLPIFVYLGITKLSNWNYFYSLLVLTATFILLKIIVDSISSAYRKLKQQDYSNPKPTFNPFLSKKKAR
ncbi:hypothetical protein EHS13_17010 [Paenibacillus psychroresistens]|uniref:Uncharacterized protein n=1 Tax=Paenibacillus psychroresistens TaxID=1778678 RepID=A0A6B8RLF6_9BACL|nr:CBO0543 family protein [Paenibacillus psychroresistens]QGQ96462.1 hypothetical protein EHS13_17010 [Paenibacillus psychroresistens]